MKKRTIATKGQRQWGGIPAIERAPNGRLWCAFFSGGPKEPDPQNFILITTSEDDGATWSEPVSIVSPPGAERAYDPNLWHDPAGRLWLIYNQAELETRSFSLWALTTDDSDRADPRWSEPVRIDLGVAFTVRLNKPTVLSGGEWLMPVTWAREAPEDWFAGDLHLQGAAVSTDSGESWELCGAVEAPAWPCENMIVERRDGRLWMLIRTRSGVLWESFSDDRGRTWSEGRATTIVNPGSRFFVRRLNSGRVMLINTPDAKNRKSLWAYLSEAEDEAGFGPGLELDAREKVSYPDAVEAPGGRIYAVHDCDRYGPAEIVLSVFSEDEIPKAGEGGETRE
jgi:predicted neuraminidase